MKTVFAAFVLILLSTTFAYGQNADWEVVVYAPGQQAILVLTPEGVSEQIPVPDEVSGQIALSPDRRYLAFSGNNVRDGERFGEFVQVADLVEQECCINVTSSKIELEGMSHVAYSVGAFNPHDSTQLSILYAAYPENAPDFSEFDLSNYGIMVINIETGDVFSHFRSGSVGRFIGWWDAGVLWSQFYSLPPGAMGAPYQQSLYQVWNPVTRVRGTIPAYSVAYFDGDIDTGETLELTGEHVVSSYAQADNSTAPASQYHYVMLYQPRNAQVGWDYQPQIIFDGGFLPPDFGSRGFRTIRWVNDGNAIYIMRSRNLPSQIQQDNPVLLFRDGTSQVANIPWLHDFLTGTPDGWLAYDLPGGVPDDNKYHIYHYQYLNGELEMRVLAEFDAEASNRAWSLTVLQRTPLGATAEPTDFPAIQLRDGLG